MATNRPNADYLYNSDYYAFVCIDQTELDEALYLPPYGNGRALRDCTHWQQFPNGEIFVQCRCYPEQGWREDRATEAEFQLWRDKYQGRNVWTVAEKIEYEKQFGSDE
jgi:hypothetical protein